MNKKQAVKNLKKVYKKNDELIIYMIEEAKDDYDSLYELRLDVYHELKYMQESLKSLFSHMYRDYFNHVTNELYFRECNPNTPLEKVFNKIDYKTTETLLQDYHELRKIVRNEEEKQSKKLDEYFRKLTGNLDLKEEKQAYKKFIEINNLTGKYIPNTSTKFNDKEIRRKEVNGRIYELTRYYNQKIKEKQKPCNQ